MTAIFVEGWIFILLSVTGVRGGLVKYMPKNIAMASSGKSEISSGSATTFLVFNGCEGRPGEVHVQEHGHGQLR